MGEGKIISRDVRHGRPTQAKFENTHTDDWDDEELEQTLVQEMRDTLKQHEVPEAMVEQAVTEISGVVEATRKYKRGLQKKESEIELVSDCM